MPQLREIASDNFMMFGADRPATQARDAVNNLLPRYIVIRRFEDLTTYYFLYQRHAFRSAMEDINEGQTLEEALKIDAAEAVPVLDAYAPIGDVPARCVIVDGDYVTGVIFTETQEAGKRGEPRRVGLEGLFKKFGGQKPEPVTRSLETDFPEEVPLGETTSLLITLVTETRSVRGPAMPVAVPVGAKIDLVLQVRQGFEIVGRAENSITVTNEEESLPVQFMLKAAALGPGKVRVFAFENGQALGSVTLAPVVVEAKAEPSTRTQESSPIAPLTFTQPDLSLLIFEDKKNGIPEITFRLMGANPQYDMNLKAFGPVRLESDPLLYFQEFFKDIEDLPISTDKDKANMEQKLKRKGANLFENLLPPDLQALLWSLRDQIKTVQVQSQEAWIPWEMLRLQGKEDGRIVEGPFLCEAFEMTRWMLEIPRVPELSLKNVGYVIPSYPGRLALTYASHERDYMKSLSGGGREVNAITPTYHGVTDALSAGEYDGVHFSGHGLFEKKDPDRSIIALEECKVGADGRISYEELSPEDISGIMKNCGVSKPLVFWNACQTGQAGLSLTGVGGWARRFINAGAGCFIGSHWSVYDEAAFKFAKAVYDNLLGGKTVGAAVKAAREAIRPMKDPTWLAYTVFADPLAKVR